MSLLLAVTPVSLVAPVASVSASGFGEVVGFGSNPGNQRMFLYTPATAGPGAAVVVLFHGCGGQAVNLDVSTGWRKYADLYGFHIVMPEQKPENVGSGGLVPHKCFSAWNDPDRTRAGEGEAKSVIQMVDHVVGTQQADRDEVFVTGYSGGGAATNVMLAAYPDRFRAGAVFFGMPYGCASSETLYFLIGGPCSGSRATATKDIRTAYPGYAGPRPPVQIWHGGQDRLISPRSLDRQRDQWADVFGISRVPVSTTTPVANVTRKTYESARIETWELAGMGHEQPINPGTGLENCGTAGQGFAAICGPFEATKFFKIGADA
ncbi:poly(hydroxyalkanoate) depolymerase family esterase [Actinoplanes lutulentus]|uniref:extracellular catalytic domain type 1 short-chain-length polyhydroxyalkanoate depolymerase n=1 Tax=Actinoplanes lutulentus TaxID=1287878 RepID=UPI000DB91BD1|nr:PHB depolymerase family esterase [Actinoplanes lutulentus]MBB2941057.1 poly(hydroxyalkanoate) depolymerase family esterase [Actinoplanes lutulentus]